MTLSPATTVPERITVVVVKAISFSVSAVVVISQTEHNQQFRRCGYITHGYSHGTNRGLCQKGFYRPAREGCWSNARFTFATPLLSLA
jgi:hypothetical protein